MECLNKIELRGVVGNVRIVPIGDTCVVRFSVATDYAFKHSDGMPVIETTWHNCMTFDLNAKDHIKKGDKVYVSGRIRGSRYMSSDGTERTTYEVIANKVQKVN